MNATDSITEAIVEHYTYIEKQYDLIPLDEWNDEFLGIDPNTRFGWSTEEIGAFCPELIAQQTADLNEEDLNDYLTAIFWILDRHIVLLWENPEMSRDERHRQIEDDLYDIGAGSIDLLNHVQLKVLDQD